MYRWWVFAHVVGAFLFVGAHGASAFVSFRVRRERDPKTVSALLQLSLASVKLAYVGLLVLIVAGVVAGFQISAWSQGWIWTAIAVLVVTTGFMYAVGTTYYQKVRTVTEAIVNGSEAVTPEQYAEVLSSRRPHLLAAVGLVALLVILWLMLLKPF
jgi:uncharacterized membrane protein